MLLPILMFLFPGETEVFGAYHPANLVPNYRIPMSRLNAENAGGRFFHRSDRIDRSFYSPVLLTTNTVQVPFMVVSSR